MSGESKRAFIVLGVGSVLVAGGMLYFWNAHKNSPGKFKQAHYLKEPTDGVMLLIAAGGNGDNYRADLVNLENGTRITRMNASGLGLKCFGHDAGRLWTYDDDLGVHARSPKDLSVILDQSKIEKANPSITKGIRSQGFHYVADKGIVVESKTGEPFLIDRDTLAATATTAGERRKKGPATGDKYRAFLEDGWTLKIDPELGLEKVKKSQYIPFDRSEKYVNGRFLRDCNGTHVAIGTPKSFIIVHDKVQGDFKYTLITRVTADGQIIWRRELDFADVDSGYQFKNLIVVAFDNPVNKAIALDVEDGHTRWTYDY